MFNSVTSLKANIDGVEPEWPIESIEPSEMVRCECEANPHGASSTGYWSWGPLGVQTGSSGQPVQALAGGWLCDRGGALVGDRRERDKSVGNGLTARTTAR